MAQLNFDASQVAPDAGVLEAIPAGWYNAAIDQSELKPTKDGSGAYLELRFNVIDGQFVNRKVFSRLNIRNGNPVAQEIAYKQLSAIAHAVGILQIADSSMLHNRPLKIKVKVRAASGDYEASNEINAFKNINEQVEQAHAAAPAAFQPPPQQAPAHQFPQQAAPQAWGAQPQQYAPAPTAQAQQYAPPVQPAPQAAPSAWQAPAAAQPWQAAPQQAPVQQQAPQQAAPTPPWMQQAPAAQPAPQQAAPQYAPAQPAGAVPPWAQPAQ
jgi:hypothetical protein